jgi:hypothetical protein
MGKPKRIILDVPRFVQGKGECGPTSLRQILAYYMGEHAPAKEEVLKNICMTEYGSWNTDLGVYAMELGFFAKITMNDVWLIDPTWASLPKEALESKIKSRILFEKNGLLREGLKSILRLFDACGNIEIAIASKEDLVHSLENGIPPLLSVCSTILRGEMRRRYSDGTSSDIEGGPRGHKVVLAGYEKGKFLVIDTNPKTEGKYWVDEARLLMAWYFWGGWVLYLEKKEGMP